MWGQPPSAVRRPRATICWHCHESSAFPTQSVRHLSTEFPVQPAKTAARAAGQPKAAVSTNFLRFGLGRAVLNYGVVHGSAAKQ